MALSVEEQILALEEQMEITKGPGSKAKKLAIQEEINKLKSQEEETALDPEETPFAKETPKVEAENLDIPKGWVQVSKAEILRAEKDGLLIGCDLVRGIALIKNHKNGGSDV